MVADIVEEVGLADGIDAMIDVAPVETILVPVDVKLVSGRRRLCENDSVLMLLL